MYNHFFNLPIELQFKIYRINVVHIKKQCMTELVYRKIKYAVQGQCFNLSSGLFHHVLEDYRSKFNQRFQVHAKMFWVPLTSQLFLKTTNGWITHKPTINLF